MTFQWTLPVEGNQRARQAAYSDTTETLAISTFNADLSLDVELYLVTFTGGIANISSLATPKVYTVKDDQCNCGGFAARRRCKHSQSVREIMRRRKQERAELDAGIDEDRGLWQADMAELQHEGGGM